MTRRRPAADQLPLIPCTRVGRRLSPASSARAAARLAVWGPVPDQLAIDDTTSPIEIEIEENPR